MNKFKKILPWLLLLAIVAIAAYLRFYHISWRGLTYDECLSEERSHWTIWHIWRYYITARAPVNALIYYINGHLFGLFTGKAVLKEWQLRLPSALFSLATIPFLFLLGRRMKDSLTGLLLAALGTASFLLVFHAREARYYSYMVFFSTVLLYEGSVILLKAGDSEKTLKNYALYSLCALCGLGSHQGFYFLFVFSNVFLFCYAALPFCLALLGRKERIKERFELFYKQFIFLALPCVAYCYQFIITTSTDKPYTPTGHGSAHLIPHLTIDAISAVLTELWQGYPFAEYVFYVSFAAFIILLFTKIRLVAFYAFFIKVFTFLFLRVATQRLTYEQFRAKYIIFVLIIDMFLIALASGFLVDWLSNKITFLFAKWQNFRAKLAAALSCAAMLALTAFVCRSGFCAALDNKLFNEQLEDIRYMFDHLKTAYTPGDIVVFQAEPNSWVHKNCLYEQSLRDYAKNWTVTESIYLTEKKTMFSKKGSYIWWMIMYRPTKGFNPYFYDGMRAYGSDVNNRNAMLMCRSATKIYDRADAIYLTIMLYHFSTLNSNHPQYEGHLIDSGLKRISYKDSVFSNYIAKTLNNGKFYAPRNDDLLKDPNLEFFAYRLINDWYNGLKTDAASVKPLLITPLERRVFSYIKACVEKNPEAEVKARDGLLKCDHGWWLYDRIYRFSYDEFKRPYLAPDALEEYMSLDDIYQRRTRLDAAYLTLNQDMTKDWTKVYRKARNHYRDKANGKKLQNDAGAQKSSL